MPYHAVKNVTPLPNNILKVEFNEGVTKIYDMRQAFEKWPIYKPLENSDDFFLVRVEVGGCGIVWSLDIDMECTELWENGIEAD